MGKLFIKCLEGWFFSCKYCRTHIAHTDQLASTAFHTLKGAAFLFHEVVNVFQRDKEDRMTEMGMQTIANIYCVRCGNRLGWKYEHIEEPTERFKIGKFLIERVQILDPYGNEYAADDENAPPSDDDDDDYDSDELIIIV